MGVELVVSTVVVTPDGGLLEGSVHALDLPIGPGMIRSGEAVLDAPFEADPIEHMDAVAGGRP